MIKLGVNFMQLATQILFLAKIPVTLMWVMHVELRSWWMKLVRTEDLLFAPLSAPSRQTLTQPCIHVNK